MSAWPMDLVKGRRSVNREMLEIERERDQTMESIQAIRDKVYDILIFQTLIKFCLFSITI